MISKLLKQVDVFSNLDSNILKTLAEITTLKQFNKDGIVFFEGEKPKYLYILLEGHLKLYKSGIKSNEVVLHYFTTPCLVAEMAILEDINFPASAVAMQDDTLLAIIKKDSFLELLHANTDFAFLLIRSLTKKIKKLEETINRNLIFDATLKVCSLLKEDPKIFRTLKNKEIAMLLNMAPETISRILKQLRDSGVIDKDNLLIDYEKIAIILNFQ